jgi:tetratricopeptide (TPR) repeat protein/SAM-dependent methyltransferase
MTTLADALRQAVAHHQQGRYAEAESLYRRILAKDRLHDEALNLLGVLCHQTGRDPESLTLLQAAISRRKRVPEYHSHLGLTLEGLGRHDEAAQAHQRAITLAPENPSFENNLGVLLLNTGRFREAVPHFERASKLRATYAEPWNNLGLVRERLGDRAGALAAYEKAVSLSPDHSTFLNNLGAMLQVQGKFGAAHGHLTRALALRPNYPECMSNLGLLLHRMGKSEEALSLFEQALKLRPAYADAMHNQAHTLHSLGRLEAAVERYEAALKVDPKHVRALLDLASLRQRQGEVEAAARLAWQVLQLVPDQREARQQFVALISLVRDRSFLDAGALARVEGMVAGLLETDGMAGGLLRQAASSLLRQHTNWASLPATLGEEHLELLRGDRLLLALLPRALATDSGFESRVTAIRAALLGIVDTEGGERFLPLACAIAENIFLAEYVHEETIEETLALATMDAQLAHGPRSPLAVVMHAAWRPMEDTPWADALLSERASLPAPVAALVTLMVEEPRRVRALGEAMPALTTIDDAVSLQVRAQYEANPYPRWRASPSMGARPWNEGFRNRFPWLAGIPLTQGNRALVAGCGTGQQPLRLAISHPELSITAIDLSRHSLGYAALRGERFPDAARIRFGHADLLKLPETESLGLFDRAYATGVLHHLGDPLEGLRAVASRVVPGGILHLGLYSRIARTRLNAVRAWARREGVKSDLPGIRAMRAHLKLAITDLDSLETQQFQDFYSTSECRDLLLHVQEHQFDTAGLQALLTRPACSSWRSSSTTRASSRRSAANTPPIRVVPRRR